MGKYVSAMVAAGARLTYERNKDDHVWFAMVLVTSGVATVYQLYWDFYRDWGLLRPTSNNLWLRDNLILKNKSIYYMSMVSKLLFSFFFFFFFCPSRIFVTFFIPLLDKRYEQIRN